MPALASDETKFRDQASQLPLTFTEALEKTEVEVQKFGETLGDAGVKFLGVVGELERSTVDNAAKGFNALGKGEHAVVDSDIVQNANKLVHGDLSNAYRTEPLPPSATNGARSEAEPAVQPQQLASLGSQLVDFITSVSAALTRNKDTTVTNPVTIGVRGATGGHVRGPGTSTSDSIPAMLSDKEYVLNAKAVERVGVENLDAINSGRAHFADGGSVTDQAQAAAKQKEQEQIDKELDALEQERSNAEAKYQKDINRLNAPEKLDVRPGTERPKPSLKSQFTTTGTGFDGAIDVRRAADLKADAAYDEQNTSVVDSDADKTLKRQNYNVNTQNLKANLEDQQARIDEREAAIKGYYSSGGLVRAFTSGGRVGHFAKGGLVGSAPSVAPTLRQLVSHFASGGRVGHFAQGGSANRASFAERVSALGLNSIHMPHLADGGYLNFGPAPATSVLSGGELSALGNLAPPAGGSSPSSEMPPHFGSLDLTTNFGQGRVFGPQDLLRQLGISASQQAMVQTGPAPSWATK